MSDVAAIKQLVAKYKKLQTEIDLGSNKRVAEVV